MRSQFTHVIDIAPTILEAAGIPEPKTVDGIAQEPMDGTSFEFTLDDPAAAERHTRAVLRDVRQPRHLRRRLVGGVAAGPPAVGRVTRDARQFGPDTDLDPDRDVGWELYDLTTDFTQAHDVAAQHPNKVRELQELWWAEAGGTACCR